MPINLASKKILVVEDQAIMRETIKHILGSFGARFIVEAENGINAITAMRIDRFDIVPCDYNLLSGKNGQQVLEEARHLKLLPVNAIFIMVTCEQSQDMVQHYCLSKVLLSVVQEDDYIVFCIEDDGKGYPESLLSSGHKQLPEIDVANGNTGLGLFFTETIAQLHVKGDKRGFIMTDNNSQLGRARFKLYLP